MQTTGNTVLITGGSSGIGFSLASKLVDRDNTVVICSRNRQKLSEAKRKIPEIHTIVCDITNEKELEALVEKIEADFHGLNVLVNNAGQLKPIDLTVAAADKKTLEEEVDTNLLAPIVLTLSLLPVLSKQPSSAIINVSSGLAYVPMASHPIYCASKAAMHSFTQSLRYQLADKSVDVIEVLPPAVDTEMAKELDTKKISPDVVAEKIVDAIEQRESEVRMGQSVALYYLSRLAPGFIYGVLNRDAN